MFVVYCKPGREAQVERGLAEQGFDPFLPLCIERGKVKPLFPRYLFSWGRIDKIRSTRGVSRILMQGDEPAVISQEMIDSIKERMAQDGGMVSFEDNSPRFHPGQRIRIIGGAYIGNEGMFVSQTDDRIVAMLSMCGRTVKATLPARHAA